MSIRNTLAAGLAAAMTFAGVQAVPAGALEAAGSVEDEITAEVVAEQIDDAADAQIADLAEEIITEAFGDDAQAVDNGALADRDGDGIPDIWEEEGVTLSDGTKLPLQAFGADPDKKDLFLQLNWMASEYETLGCGNVDVKASAQCAKANKRSYRPSPEILDQLVDLFAQHDINLHIDAGATYTNIDNYGPFHGGQTLDYKEYYLNGEKPATALLRAQRELLGARDAVFRVGVIGDYMDYRDTSTGIAVVGGNAFYVANFNRMRNQEELRNTILHEFGHTLGLRHNGHKDYVEGLDNNRMHPGYHSVMSYSYQMRRFDYSTEAYTRTDNGETRTVPADWDVIELGSPAIGKGAHSIGADIDPADVAATAEQKARAAEALANNGKVEIATPAPAAEKVNAGDKVEVVLEVANPGLDLATYTIDASYAGGNKTQEVTLEGALSGNNTAEVVFEIPMANLKSMPINFTVSNGGEIVANTIYTVSGSGAGEAIEGASLADDSVAQAPAAGSKVNVAAIVIPVVLALLAAIGAGFAMMNR